MNKDQEKIIRAVEQRMRDKQVYEQYCEDKITRLVWTGNMKIIPRKLIFIEGKQNE